MVLQYADGGNLRDFLRNNFAKFDWQKKINMGKQIASGLKCIHERGIVHRDLVCTFQMRELIIYKKIKKIFFFFVIYIFTENFFIYIAFKKYIGSRGKNDDNRFWIIEIGSS